MTTFHAESVNLLFPTLSHKVNLVDLSAAAEASVADFPLWLPCIGKSQLKLNLIKIMLCVSIFIISTFICIPVFHTLLGFLHTYRGIYNQTQFGYKISLNVIWCSAESALSGQRVGIFLALLTSVFCRTWSLWNPLHRHSPHWKPVCRLRSKKKKISWKRFRRWRTWKLTGLL